MAILSELAPTNLDFLLDWLGWYQGPLHSIHAERRGIEFDKSQWWSRS
jgi:hypothetical protein